MRIINSKIIVVACNSLITCYLVFIIGDLAIFNNLFFCKRCSLSAPSWLEKEEQLSWLSWLGFCKIFMFKKEYFVVFCLSKVVLM